MLTILISFTNVCEFEGKVENRTRGLGEVRFLQFSRSNDPHEYKVAQYSLSTCACCSFAKQTWLQCGISKTQ